ncbi:hypothetical protein [Roseateles sp. LYH14W]|uniref:Uncharacterized protein n=1 Tax=Pelomonas parva TaxID=3299032 RepID=A0ABW7FB02_9BURK
MLGAGGLPPVEATSPGQVIGDVMARYRRQMLALQQVLEEDADRDRTRALLADMLGLARC